MAVPGSATYSASAKVAAHTAFRDLIDAGAAAGYIAIRDSSEVSGYLVMNSLSVVATYPKRNHWLIRGTLDAQRDNARLLA